jgi:predicted TIM-barrel fold metal-dependent hydrolase
MKSMNLGTCNGLWRRDLVATALFLIALQQAAASISDPTGGPPIPVIDVHTHVFNARDVPIAGALQAQTGLPGDICDLIADIMKQNSEPDSHKGKVSAMDIMTKDFDKGRSFKLSGDQRARLMEELNRGTNGAPMTTAAGLSNVALFGQFMDKKAKWPPPCGSNLKTAPAVVPEFGTEALLRPHTWDWIKIMLSSHDVIISKLYSAFPVSDGTGVDLFVHHMMDLDRTYNDHSINRFPEQVAYLSQETRDPSYNGKSLFFVAFDPFRRDLTLESVKDGIQKGAAGVKFYPPSGYRPAGNDPLPPKPCLFHWTARGQWNSRYHGMDGAKLDAYCDALFDFCEKNDIPIFTHCSPNGFQAVDGYGLMGDPKYWAIVLQKHPKLRLCFAHSGGDDYWFASAAPVAGSSEYVKWNFGAEVVQLCENYPNVYCEVGYLEEINENDTLAIFTDLLMRHYADTGVQYQFGSKLMYGTDWHLVAQENDTSAYLSTFEGIFRKNASIQKWELSFFSGNAAQYLRLADLAHDGRYTEAQRSSWQSIIDAIANSRSRIHSE